MSQRIPPYCASFQNQSGLPPAAAVVTRLLIDLVRRNINRLNHAPDRTRLHQVAGLHRALHLKPLAVHDAVDSLRLRDRLPHLSQLLQRSDARFVGEKVLPRAHHTNAQRRTLARNLRTQHKLNRRIMQNLIFRRRPLHIRIALLERSNLIRLRPLRHHQLAAATLNRTHHPIDVVMTHARDRKPDLVLWCRQRFVCLRNLMHDWSVIPVRQHLLRKSTTQSCRSHSSQKRPTIKVHEAHPRMENTLRYEETHLAK